MQKGQKVRLKADPGRVGYFTGKTRDVAGRVYYQIDFLNCSEYHAEDQLESADVPLDPIERLREGQLGRVHDLRRLLTHVCLSGRLANLIYSMEITNTDFYAYQFKPVLKLLNSPTKGILIADEVGLGKTIEAGLVWTELRSRFEERRLMVLCLAVLRPKWQRELRNRFGIEAEVLGAEDVLSRLERTAGDESYSSFSIVSSIQGLRPRRGWDDDEQAPHNWASRLARFLEQRAEEEPLIDLLVIDEAHYLRNPESMTNVLARLLCAVSNRVLLLSATPIHLRNADLYYLLNLVDPDTFNQSAVFDSVLEANAPVIKARDAVIAGETRRERILEMLRDAQAHPYLQENRQLRSLVEELEGDDPPLRDHDYRSKLVFRLDGVNLLNNVVARTRKREIQEWRVVREPTPQKVPMSQPEREFYESVTTLLREFCLQYRQHEGFLLVMPQRQMSSSMPAALREWKRRRALYEDEYFEDFGVEEVEPPGPILEEIFRNLENLAATGSGLYLIASPQPA